MVGNEPLIKLENLKTYFHTEDGVVKAVDGVNFQINEDEVLGVVGESGCGKSITALSILQLIPRPFGIIEDGTITYYKRINGGTEPIDITSLDPRGHEIRSLRGNEIAMIFQEPMTSLNPVYTVGDQIMEAVILHQGAEKREARARAIEMLAKVQLPNPEQVVDEYPHQLSGGMRQRAMIAIALSCNPKILIADEPTTALDVTTQAKILDLLLSLQKEFNTAIMMITHDLGVIAEISYKVVVMYLGKVVESGNVKSIFHNPQHPYTRGLLKSIPIMGKRMKERLIPIQGVVPDPFEIPAGCPFRERCPEDEKQCKEGEPPLVEVEEGHEVRCWMYE